MITHQRHRRISLASGVAAACARGTVRFVLVLYDDDCGMCSRCVAWASLRAPHLCLEPLGEQSDSVVVRTKDGRELVEAAAVAAVLRECGGWWALLGRALELPVLRRAARTGYRFVAKRRDRISRVLGWSSCEVG